MDFNEFIIRNLGRRNSKKSKTKKSKKNYFLFLMLFSANLFYENFAERKATVRPIKLWNLKTTFKKFYINRLKIKILSKKGLCTRKIAGIHFHSLDHLKS